MFLTSAYAQSAAGQPSSIEGIFGMLLPMVLVMGVFWFFLLRPQQKKMQAHREAVQGVRRGDTVVVSGMIGKVHRVVDDQEVLVDLAENVRVRVLKALISDVRAKGEHLKEEPSKDSSDKGHSDKGHKEE